MPSRLRPQRPRISDIATAIASSMPTGRRPVSAASPPASSDHGQGPVKSAIAKAQAIKAANDAARVAIIHKRGLEGLPAHLKGISEPDLSWGSFDPFRISVMDVEMSKGLEFEAVIVIENCMTDNERYIAYTRALDNLLVATTKGLSHIGNVNVTSLSHSVEHDMTE